MKIGRTLAALAATGGCAAALVGCDRVEGRATPRAEALVVTEAPRGAAAPLLDPGAFRDPWPSRSRVVVREGDRLAGAARSLTEGFDAAGGARVDPEGRRVLFCGRRPGEPWRAWIVPLAGGEPFAVSPADSNAVSADWLPDERLVLSSDRGRWRDPRDGGAAFSLFTVRADGSDLTRITFGPSSEIDPHVLADGRVLYSSWQPPGLGRPDGGWGLFTVREDGTGVFAFRGHHDGPGLERRPRQIAGRLAVLVDREGGGAEAVAARMSRPLVEATALATGSGDWRSVEPWRDGGLLAALRPDADAASFGLYLVGEEGALEPLLDDPELDELEAVRAAPRPRPRGHLSLVKPGTPTGELVVLDARRTLLPPGATLPPGRAVAEPYGRAVAEPYGRAVALVVERAVAEPLGGAGGDDGALPGLPRREPVAQVPLAEDGSAFFEVPADTPLVLSTEDAEGRRLLDSSGWIWVRPAEKRACIGCHESRETAPPNRVVDALAAPDPHPVRLGSQEAAQR